MKWVERFLARRKAARLVKTLREFYHSFIDAKINEEKLGILIDKIALKYDQNEEACKAIFEALKVIKAGLIALTPTFMEITQDWKEFARDSQEKEFKAAEKLSSEVLEVWNE